METTMPGFISSLQVIMAKHLLKLVMDSKPKKLRKC